MGGSDSKSSSSEHDLWQSDEDRLRAKTLFNEIAHGQKSFTKEQFHHYTNHVLDSYTSSRIFDLFLEPQPHRGHHRSNQHAQHSNHAHPHEVHQHNFTSHLGVMLNGSISDKAKIVVFLSSISPSKVSSTDLVSFVSRTIQQYKQLLHAHCVAYQSWMFSEAKDSHDRLAISLLSALLASGQGVTKPVAVSGSALEVDPNLMFTESDVEDWLEKSSFFRDILEQTFIGIFQFYESQPGQMVFSPRLPQVQDTNWSRISTILDFPTVLFVNNALPQNMQTPWRLLFSNHMHGDSFSQLLKNIRNQGPTVLLVRDDGGRVFGGYASQSWDLNPKFQGDETCFLFQANPRYSIYQATGYNQNFMYMNYHVQTLPNGVGMGGQLEYFGLWIDQSFDNGHSKAGSKGCSTFGSPPLSASQEFKIDTIEVWAVGKVKREGEFDDSDEVEGAQGQRSILDKLASEDKAILDMVDRGTISDAIRAEPIVEETAAHNTIISPF